MLNSADGWKLSVQYLGLEGRLGTETEIPFGIKAAMKDFVASTELETNQFETDLEILTQLYGLGNSKIDNHFERALLTEELTKSITKQLLNSDLFEPSPQLKRLLDQRQRNLENDAT